MSATNNTEHSSCSNSIYMYEGIKHSLLTDNHFTIFGIPVIIEKEDDHFIVTDSEINMYGIGRTRKDAEEDYKSVILEYFEFLNENEGKLSDHLRRHLCYLRVKERHFRAA